MSIFNNLDNFKKILEISQHRSTDECISGLLKDRYLVEYMSKCVLKSNIKVPYILGRDANSNVPIMLNLSDINTGLVIGGSCKGKTYELAKILALVSYFDKDSHIVICDVKESRELSAFKCSKSVEYYTNQKDILNTLRKIDTHNEQDNHTYVVIDELNSLMSNYSSSECTEITRILNSLTRYTNKKENTDLTLVMCMVHTIEGIDLTYQNLLISFDTSVKTDTDIHKDTSSRVQAVVSTDINNVRYACMCNLVPIAESSEDTVNTVRGIIAQQ